MWVLSFSAPPSEVGREICLPATAARSFTIGRKECDVTFPNDPRVSREHCKLETLAAGSAAHGVPAAPTIVFVDNSSYGSAVNGQTVKKKTVPIEPGSTMRVGDRRMRLLWRPVCLCRSRIDPEGRVFVDSMAQRLGVHVTDEWSSQVTHLAMSKVLFTPKLLLALAYRVPIVVPLWLQALEDSLRRLGPCPDVSGSTFVPPHTESWRNPQPQAIDLRPERATLFAQREFVFYAPANKAASAARVSAEIVRACGGVVRVVTCAAAAPPGATPQASGLALAAAGKAEEILEGADELLHVQPSKALQLTPEAADALERARADRRVVSEESIRVCLITASTAQLVASLGGGGTQQPASQRIADSQPAPSPTPPTPPAPAPSAAALVGGAGGQADELQGQHRLTQQAATEMPTQPAPPTKRAPAAAQLEAAGAPSAKRSRTQPREPSPLLSARPAAPSGSAPEQAAGAQPGKAGTGKEDGKAGTGASAADALEAELAPAELPRARVVHLRAAEQLAPGARASNAPQPQPQPQPLAAEEELAQEPQHLPAREEPLQPQPQPQPQPRAPIAPIAGWRSKRSGGGADNVSLSRSGEGAEAGQRVAAEPDEEAARTAIVPLVSRSANECVLVAPRKRFCKAPIRRVGQAYVPLVPDNPTLGADEEAVRREIEEEQRYSSKADKLFKEAKDLPTRAPASKSRR